MTGRPSAKKLAEEIDRKIRYAVEHLGHPCLVAGRTNWQEYTLPGNYGPYDRQVIIRANSSESEAVVSEIGTSRIVARPFTYPNKAGACDCFEGASHLEPVWQSMLDDAVQDAIRAAHRHK